MAVDAALARGLEIAPLTVRIDRQRLVFFAKATGQSDPIYLDVDAARAAGHPDVPAPPTFFFSLEMETPDPFEWLTALSIDLRHVLHAEQAFTYHSLAYAGETVSLRRRVTDTYTKKNGALNFVVKQTDIARGSTMLAEATATIAVRDPAARR